jgi:hypothetical protein
MRKIREVLRLRFGQGLRQRAIGQSLRLSVGAVNAYLSRFRMAGLGWPLPAEFDQTRQARPPPPDGPTADAHDKVRGPGSFAKTVPGIRKRPLKLKPRPMRVNNSSVGPRRPSSCIRRA